MVRSFRVLSFEHNSTRGPVRLDKFRHNLQQIKTSTLYWYCHLGDEGNNLLCVEEIALAASHTLFLSLTYHLFVLNTSVVPNQPSEIVLTVKLETYQVLARLLHLLVQASKVYKRISTLPGSRDASSLWTRLRQPPQSRVLCGAEGQTLLHS